LRKLCNYSKGCIHEGVVIQSNDFAEVIQLIEDARKQAYQAVNKTLIELYWQVGEYISHKLKAAEWGDGVVDQLARHRRA
jgi:hypothetical protein